MGCIFCGGPLTPEEVQYLENTCSTCELLAMDDCHARAPTTGQRILVTGGRTYDNRHAVYAALDRLHTTRGIRELAHGATPGGRGADWLADAWARMHEVPVHRYRVDERRDGPWPGAGPRRNRRMACDFRPDGVVAFPGGPGTASMVAIADEMRMPVWWPLGKPVVAPTR